MSNPIRMKNILITGSSGLIGSEAVTYFAEKEYFIFGMDNNMRRDFFGQKGDTLWNLKRLKERVRNFEHYDINIVDRERVLQFFKEHKIDAVIHCAAQPSHDLAKDRPFDDFEVNATGTLNLLEATRQHCLESPFVFMSTNKVYGDAPNELPLKELETRWDFSRPDDYDGIEENCRIDQSKHSLFGASKAAADLMVQEYGRYFNMPTVCFRAGCLTGPNHSGVELHGFLSYLVKVTVAGGKYVIFGYKGKQVRDQIHSIDIAKAMEEFIDAPRCGEVYNIGGGRGNSASVLECIDMVEKYSGRKLEFQYNKKNREGDHIVYISNLSKFKKDYPKWSITVSLQDIIKELIDFETKRQI